MSNTNYSKQWADELLGAYRKRPGSHAACPDQVRILKRTFAKLRPGYLMKVILSLCARERRMARREIKEQLHKLVTSAMTRYRATSAWLYILEPDDSLRAMIACNTNHRDHRLALLDPVSVVAHVAKERQGELLDNVHACSYYKASIPDTLSELAVPILTQEKPPRLLGVLNLESHLPTHFPRGSVESLQKEVGSLVPSLLCREAIRLRGSAFHWPWHTGKDGWDLSKALGRICCAVAAAVHDDRAACAVWHADWDKQTLFALATSGLHADFVNKRMLPPGNSVTGRGCRLRPGEWIRVPSDDPNLYDRERLLGMGMSEMLTTPVYAPSSAWGEGSIGAVNMYLYQKVDPEIPSFPQQVASVAIAVGEMLSGYASLREAVACADLHHRLETSEADALHSVSDYATVRDTVARWLSADGCSVFLHDKAKRRLLCMATTGVVVKGKAQEIVVHTVGNNKRDKSITDALSIDLTTNKGLLAHIARHPGMVMRLHRTKDEQGADYLPPAPVFAGFWDYDIPTEHRRFLSISVTHEGETHFVVRVARRIDRPPFTKADEELLRKMTEIWMARLSERWKSLRLRAEAEEEIKRMYIDIGGGGGGD